MITRRTLLITGSASLVIVTSGCKTPSAASQAHYRQPWDQASNGFGDVRLNALAYAILAPSPHNRQPWLVKLNADDETAFTVYCDMNRLLPETDPFNRQIVIGFGAFLELLKLAAAEQGYKAEISPFPKGEAHPNLDERPIASVRMIPDPSVERSPLFKHALSRRTTRQKFSGAPISDSQFKNLTTIAQLSSKTRFSSANTAGYVDPIKAICIAGYTLEVATERTHLETVALTRIGAEHVKANPDGVSLLGTGIEIFRRSGILTPQKLKTPGTKAYDGALSFYNGLIESAKSYGWLLTPGNSRMDQLNAGADWIRLNLAAAQMGIAMHPLSQVLQEFPEMSDLYAHMHSLLDVKAPHRIQGLFRFGYADVPRPSPRWPLESRLITIAL